MTINELKSVRDALILGRLFASQEKDIKEFKEAQDLIEREIELKTMDPRMTKEVNMDANYKMYGE